MRRKNKIKEFSIEYTTDILEFSIEVFMKEIKTVVTEINDFENQHKPVLMSNIRILELSGFWCRGNR